MEVLLLCSVPIKNTLQSKSSLWRTVIRWVGLLLGYLSKGIHMNQDLFLSSRQIKKKPVAISLYNRRHSHACSIPYIIVLHTIIILLYTQTELGWMSLSLYIMLFVVCSWHGWPCGCHQHQKSGVHRKKVGWQALQISHRVSSTTVYYSSIWVPCKLI